MRHRGPGLPKILSEEVLKLIPGPDLILACPRCGMLVRRQTLLSGNTLGAIYWTDGKCEAPMLPDLPDLVRCRGCGGFYWLAEAKVEGTLEPDLGPGSVPEAWLRAPVVQHPTVTDYLDALSSGVTIDPQKERHLRLRLWWAINDLVRHDAASEVPPEYREAAADNLRRLFDLLDEDEPEERVMKAEAARELGDFQEALRLLDHVPEQVRPAAEVVRALAQQGVTRVAELRPRR